MRKIVAWVILSVVAANMLAACTPKDFFPESGEWYCEELEMCLSFTKGTNSYRLVNGFKEKCGCRIRRGSSWILIRCQQSDCPLHELGEEVLYAQIISLDDNSFILKDKDDKTYAFSRVG